MAFRGVAVELGLRSGRRILLVAAASFFLLSCMCGDRTVATADAPDGQHSAVWIERNCGATTDYATHVVLRTTGWFPDSETVFVASSTAAIAFRWRSARELVIRYEPAEVFVKESEALGVRIVYE